MNSVSTALIEAPLRFQFRVNKRSGPDQTPSAQGGSRDLAVACDFLSRRDPSIS